MSQYRCAQQPAAIEQRPRSSARPVLPTGADRSSVRANRSELHPSRGPASPPTVIAKKNSTKRIQQKGLRRPVRQVPPQSGGGTLRAREDSRERRLTRTHRAGGRDRGVAHCRLMLFWLVQIDRYLVTRPEAVPAASGFYFMGRKCRAPIGRAELLGRYRPPAS